jgi:hypothetical protein
MSTRTPKEPVAVCCGRPISHEEFLMVKETVETFPRLSRRELTQTVCELLEWRTASGTNKLDACSTMLSLFEKRGIFTLPEKKIQARPQPSRIVITPRSDPGPEISADLKSIGPVSLLQVRRKDHISLWNEHMARYHYLGHTRPFGYFIRYHIWHPGGFLGCALFSGAAKAIRLRDQWIGWTAEQRLQNLAWVVNNTRFLIFPWVKVKNLASHVLGQFRRCIGRHWQKQWGFMPVLLETFVDPEHFKGTCYQAANWTYLGMTTGKGLARKNKTYQTSPKKIFMQPLTKDFKKILCRHNITPEGENP